MLIIPSIDVLNGQCVRLKRGDFEHVTAYTNKAQELVEMALGFEAEGAKRMHLVDLKGSLTGSLQELALLKTLRQSLEIPLQIGGGIRSYDQAKACIELGFDIVLGTLIVSDPATTARLLKQYPSKIIAALDCRPINASIGNVAINGWTDQTQTNAENLLKQLESQGCERYLYTDISRDGMLTGPALSALRTLKRLTAMDLIASGGIQSIDDLIALKQIGCQGAIVGKAFCERKFTFAEADQALHTANLTRMKRGALC